MKVKKAQKAQMGKDVPKKKAMTETGKMVDRKEFLKRRDSITKSMNEQYFSRPENSKMKPVVPKKKAKDGSSLKPVDSSKNPGLAKLPTPVRNKMGYQKNGGKLKKQAAVAIAMKKAGKSPKKAMGGMKMMKGGGKCKYGC